MPNEVTVRVTSKDDTDFDTPAQGAKRYGDAIDGVGEKADASEARILGAKDAVDGVATIMQGPGEQGMAAYLQGWADLASGIANFIIPAVKAVATTGAQTAATIAHTAASKAAAVASKAWAAVQWVLNAALTANPIGLVVVAIAALIAIIVIAWKRSDTFRKIVTGAFQGIVSVASAVAAWFANKFWPWLRGVWDAIAGKVVSVKDSIARTLNGVVTFVAGLPGRISKAASGLWGGITSGIGGAVNWVKGKANDLVKWLGGLPRRVSQNVSGMFNGISGAFRSAINWVIGRWNNLSFSIPGVDTHIPGIGTIGGFTLHTPNLPYLARGGTARRGGLAVVGENGAEVVDLPSGASVFPMNRVGGGGQTVIHLHVGTGSRFVRALMEDLREQIRIEGGTGSNSVQVVLGQ